MRIKGANQFGMSLTVVVARNKAPLPAAFTPAAPYAIMTSPVKLVLLSFL